MKRLLASAALAVLLPVAAWAGSAPLVPCFAVGDTPPSEEPHPATTPPLSLASRATHKAHGRAAHARAGRAGWMSNASWSAQTSPAPGPAQAIGGYAAGCLRGAVPLAAVGPGFEVLHRGRQRYFGHPQLIEFVRRLAARASERDLPPLLIGDLSQARGGPTPSGHGSHQSGLDVDVSYTRPAAAMRQPLSSDEREAFQFPVVVDLEKMTLTSLWTEPVAGILQLAASDPAVDRIFVNPVVKRELCTSQPSAPWLGRLRPWWGHHDHFHVRLRCPAGSPGCLRQPPVPEGDGCGAELGWWFSATARQAAAARRAARPGAPSPRLPQECKAVLR